jgi:regulatory protein
MLKSRFGPKAGKQGALRTRAADGSNRADDLPVVNEESRADRLEHARVLLKQATEQPKATRVADARSPATPIPEASFEDDADPFEPFEQCAPSAPPPPAADESVYSRSSDRRRAKASAKELRAAKRPKLSLKGRALGYLSRREYSRAELSRRLRPYAEENDSVDTVLDELERDGWLSNERFVESVVHRRATRMGGKRIIDELKRHAVGDTLITETAGKLAQTETERARAVWEKKFGTPPETPAERAKQSRFLAARGFSGSTIGKILKGGEDDWTDEFDGD